jgi:peptidoglycan/xylan/chitin deacetylase (PgdA/CDA1 family)
MRAAALAGHLDLCNHGYSHRTGRSTSESAGLADLRANAPLDRAIGISSIPFYRPPYGLLSPGLTRAAERLGYRYVLLWDVDPSDYASPPPSVVATRVVRAARPGSIVVLHLKASTAAALPLILRGLRAKGLRAVTAGRLLRAS